MEYKLIVSPRAQTEIEDAIDYYALYSSNASLTFIRMLKYAYKILETNPFFEVRYKNIRAIKISKYPYLLYFTINENERTVSIHACFNNKQNPSKRP
jgi:toxin ParE1/3/4